MKKLLILSLLLSYSLNSLACCFHARSKTSEAKIQLAAAYTAQQAHYGDFGSYGPCFKYMGYDPTVETNSRYFAIGFKHIEIHPKFLKHLKKNGKEDLIKNCFENPVSFFPNGKGELVTLEDFPDEAKLTIDENGKATFKIFAVAKGLGSDADYEYKGKSVLALNQNKVWDIKSNDAIIPRPFYEKINLPILGMIFLTIFLYLLIINAPLYFLLRKKNPRGKLWITIESILVLVIGFLVTIVAVSMGCPKGELLLIPFALIGGEFWAIRFRQNRARFNYSELS